MPVNADKCGVIYFLEFATWEHIRIVSIRNGNQCFLFLTVIQYLTLPLHTILLLVITETILHLQRHRRCVIEKPYNTPANHG